MKKLSTTFILLVCLMIPLCYGLFQGGLIKGHDAIGGLMRLLYMDRYLGDGQLYPRWFPEVNLGYGSPMFNFYQPLFYFVGILFFKITHQGVLSLNLTCVLFWVLSGVGMYFFARELFGHKGGVLSAVAYMYSPYHIQDLYVRGAFSEFSAFAFFPLLLFSFLKISQKVEVKYIALGVISVASLSLMHNIMSMLFFPVVLCYIVFLSLTGKNIRSFLLSLFIILIGLMISAFFWLPAFQEKKFLNLIFLIFLHYEFHQNFLSWTQLLNTPWGVDLTDTKHQSFHIGIFSMILGLLPLAFIVQKFKERRDFFLQYLFFIVVAIGAIFLIVPLSHIIWEKVVLLRLVQFPWRFLAIVSFAISLLSGGILAFIQSKSLSNAVLGIAIVLIILSAGRFLYPITSQAVDEDFLKKDISNTMLLGEGEYTPLWIMLPPEFRPFQKFQLLSLSGGFSQYTIIVIF